MVFLDLLSLFRKISASVLAVCLVADLGVAFADESSVKSKFGDDCIVYETCGDFLHIDCNSAVDGPAYWVRRDSLQVLGEGGGICLSPKPCSGPPREWIQCMTKKAAETSQETEK